MFSLCKNFSTIRRVFSPSFGKSVAGICSQDQTLTPRVAPSRKASGQRYNVPPSAEAVARVSGIATMARLPYRETADGLDAAFVGVPIDTGTSNRPGARSGYNVGFRQPTADVFLRFASRAPEAFWLISGLLLTRLSSPPWSSRVPLCAGSRAQI